jgi:hypothetical protein
MACIWPRATSRRYRPLIGTEKVFDPAADGIGNSIHSLSGSKIDFDS